MPISSLTAFMGPAPHLHSLDLALIAIYLLGITLFGLRFRQQKSSSAATAGRSLQSYFLADHSIPWWAISLSIVSAETSTLTIISVPGVAFTSDFAFLQIVLGYLLGRIVVAAIFLPRYFQGNMLTAYQLIDRRFGPALHKVTAALFLITRAAAEGVRVFAISIVVGIAIGTADVLSIAIISALTLLYTFEGGLAAVIWTDVVQMGLYLAGTLVAVATLGTHVSGGWPHIASAGAAAGKFHIFYFALNLSQTYTFWAGILGGTFLTMASHGTDQLMVQRMLAARSLRDSRLALLTSGLVILLQFSLFLLIGAGLYVFYGQHPASFASADRIFPTFIVQQMPTGVAGLLVAAILAAAMSNLSAALNSLSSATVVDFYMHARPGAGSRERMIASRISTVAWALLLFGIAVYSIRVGGKGHVVETGLSIASVAYGALLGVFLLGTLTRYATQTGAICGMVAGFASNLVLWLHPAPIHLGFLSVPRIAFTWYVIFGSIITFAVGSAASMVFNSKPTRKTVTIAAILLSFLATSLAQGTGATSIDHPASCLAPKGTKDFSPIDAAVTRAIQAKKLPGAVVLIGQGDRVVFEKAYGNRALEPVVEPMTEDTVFDMASLTKSLVTSVAVMQLVERDHLSIDDPVAKFLPDFSANGKQDVTIRELLTHYSGLPPDVDIRDPWGLAAPNKAEGIRRALNSSLDAKPGIHFEYSDVNFITLGAFVEKLSGEPLDTYAQEHIFSPLKMMHTRFLPIAEACGTKQVIGSAVSLSGSDQRSASAKGAALPGCTPGGWKVAEWIPQTAPTAHDDEGTIETNPDFDHILRGTVHDPTTRRMGGVAGHAGLFSNAFDLSLYTQALLDRMLHNSGNFPLKQSTLQMMMSPQQPGTAETTATIFSPDGHQTKGVALRGLGWDINSAFSRPRGEIFPIGSFGHTGFTGTSLWIDPGSDSYVILLANAIHPHVGPAISPLRGEVATLAARALGICPTPVSGEALGSVPQNGKTTDSRISNESNPTTLTGIDRLEATKFSALAAIAARHHENLRVGLLTNQTGVDAMGRRTIDVLYTDAPRVVPGLALKMLFSPEHGIYGEKDSTDISDSRDPGTQLQVASLYGPKDSDRRPSHEQLKNLDAIIIDLQDAGVRFYTYETVLGYFLEAAAQENAHGHNLEIIVLDRPDPLGGEQVQGPLSDAGLESYTDYMALPVRHGLTLGELARYFNGERRLPSPTSSNVYAPLQAPLTVVPMLYWHRNEYFDETKLPWHNPSPNLRSVEASTLYPGVALLETSNVSVGRGTATPFEAVGAPYIEASRLAEYLTNRHIPGVTFAATTMGIAEDPNHYPFHGQTVGAVRFHITQRNLLNAPELGIELIAALHRLYPQQFNLAKTRTLIANSDTSQSLEQDQDPRAIAASWSADLEKFAERRRPYLLYR